MGTDRRTLLRGLVVAAGTAALGSTGTGTAHAQDQPLDADPLLHLLRRATYGPTPELVGEARRLGATKWLDRQLSPGGISDSPCQKLLAAYPLLTANPPTVRRKVGNGGWTAMEQVVQAHLVRAVWSKRQLFEVMVDFWSNHFNVATPSSEVWDCKPFDDRSVIRPHALGKFASMLQASARSPAMLRYLDNADSRGAAPNENYGREILELHTVGIDAGYTEADMRHSALALTGLTVWNPWDKGCTSGNVGSYRLRNDWHHVGPLTVLGWSHPNAKATDANKTITSYLNYLARHPSTARRIARKLCVRFVSDTPPQPLVDRLSGIYLARDTAIAPVLRALFSSPEFAASAGQKTRRPFEDAVATVRALRIPPASAKAPGAAVSDLVWVLGDLGHAPLAWKPPNGYPDVAPAWSSPATTLGRWNLHVGLAQGWWAGRGLARPDWKALVGTPATAGELVDRLAGALLSQPLGADETQALLDLLECTAGDPPPGPALVPVLAALLLDSPVFGLR